MKLKLNLFMKMKKPVCKLPLSLKMTLFVLFSFASLLYASNNYAQRTMLNISSQTRTVSEVLTEIEKQTDFTFFYNNKQVDLKRKVTLNVKNENVFSVLKKLFSEQIRLIKSWIRVLFFLKSLPSLPQRKR